MCHGRRKGGSLDREKRQRPTEERAGRGDSCAIIANKGGCAVCSATKNNYGVSCISKDRMSKLPLYMDGQICPVLPQSLTEYKVL
jgi:hypothetical protein